MKTNQIRKNINEQIIFIINSFIEMIKNSESYLGNNSYFYYNKKIFIIYLYLFKLVINDNDYLKNKYFIYIRRFGTRKELDMSKVTNIKCRNIIDFIMKIKERNLLNEFSYDEKNNRILIGEDYIEANWFLTFMSLLLDNVRNDQIKKIDIFYTIPDKNIEKVNDETGIKRFLQYFTYYSIRVRHIDAKQPIKENNLLIVKNAAINYLKHLKQYKHGLEGEESYKIFYNLFKSECHKNGLEYSEKTINLLEVDSKYLDKLKEYMDMEFYEASLSRQVHIIENFVWQSSNDITLHEQVNKAIDELIYLIALLHFNDKKTYKEVKEGTKLNDIHLLFILVILKFLCIYNNPEEIDYSLLNLKNIKPKYMNSISRTKEQEIKNKIKILNMELASAKKDLDKYKQDRANIDTEGLQADKYKKMLEVCVGNINRVSIVIARLNSNISSLSKEYEDLRKELTLKCRDADLYNYNMSVIKHLVNSIMNCSFYLKTNNMQAMLSNIITFEDYEKTDNSFFLEVALKDLLNISNLYKLNGIIDQNDLPKLA